MLYKSLSAAVYGIDAYLVEVEVDVALEQSANCQDGHISDLSIPGPNVRTCNLLRKAGDL